MTDVSRRSPSSIITGARTAWLVALVPLLIAVLGLGLLGEGDREQRPTDSLPAGLDSTLATELGEQVGAEDSDVAIVLFTADKGRLDEAQRGDIADLAGSVGAAPESLSVAEDGTAAFVVVPIDAASATATIDEVKDLRDTLDKEAPAGTTTAVTGPAGIQADLAEVFAGANFRLLAVTAAVVAILLIITYRSPVLWVIPLLVVGIADRLAGVVATHVMAALDVAWNESTIGILSVLVFGAGTNYALLLISRYRDELGHTESRHEAMGMALRSSVEPILASATTVVVGLLTLFLSLTPTTRGLGLACAIGILVAAFFVLVVLPAVLVLFGRWIFWPRAPKLGDAALTERPSLWRRVGNAVERRPVTLAAGAVVALALLSIGLVRVDTGLDQADQFLDKPEAIAAGERLAESFPAGVSSPTEILTRADVERVVAAAEGVAGVASVRPTQEDDGIARVQVVLESAPGSGTARTAVEELRDAVDDLPDTHVGGAEAAALDEADAASRDRLLILPLILLVVLLALVTLLRAVVAPVLLVATVLATYCASMGVSWWLFSGPLGFDALDADVPLFAFLFLVALGVDYNIFLVTRARQEARAHGTRAGMLRALAATGGVITSAGILLGAVFAVLGVLPLVVLAQLGLIVCIGVLLDTLVVRTVLVPALALLLGDRFWWPAAPDRIRGDSAVTVSA
ncbi:MAG: MMPL family transporter [Propionibacteriales bacterium]|nr:MMPL family transporter [Propionibacteriales bacterium]